MYVNVIKFLVLRKNKLLVFYTIGPKRVVVMELLVSTVHVQYM